MVSCEGKCCVHSCLSFEQYCEFFSAAAAHFALDRVEFGCVGLPRIRLCFNFVRRFLLCAVGFLLSVESASWRYSAPICVCLLVRSRSNSTRTPWSFTANQCEWINPIFTSDLLWLRIDFWLIRASSTLFPPSAPCLLEHAVDQCLQIKDGILVRQPTASTVKYVWKGNVASPRTMQESLLTFFFFRSQAFCFFG